MNKAEEVGPVYLMSCTKLPLSGQHRIDQKGFPRLLYEKRGIADLGYAHGGQLLIQGVTRGRVTPY